VTYGHSQQWGGSPQPGAGYEFSEAENAIIGRAGARARVWGFIAMILGGVMVLCGAAALAIGGAKILFTAGTVVTAGLVPLACGKLYVDAGNALAAVVDTRGNDVAHMMLGIAKLRSALRLESILGLAAIAAGIALGVWAAGQGLELRTP
jgi:hypothetical protein